MRCRETPSQEWKQDFAKAVPLGRVGNPDEIAKAVSFLASDEASYISGMELLRRWRRSSDLIISARVLLAAGSRSCIRQLVN